MSIGHTRPVHDVAASLPARCRRRPGAALDGVAAGLWPGGRAPARPTTPPAPAGHRLLLERRRADALVGQGQRRGDGARTRPPADAAASRGHGLHPGPLQPVGACLDQPAPGPHEPAVGRVGQPRPERDPRRHVDGPGASRRPSATETSIPEPRARHRAQRAAAGRRALDDLRVEPVVGLAHASRPPRRSIPSRAFDRLVGDGSGRALDRSILDAVRQESQSLRPRISKDDNHKLSEYFEGIRDIEKRIERASTEERLEGWRPTLAAARHAAPEARAAAERARSHEADARPDRARVPDGQDARGDADAQQRPVADELQVRRGRAGRPAPRPHAQRARRREGSDVPEDQPVPHRAVRLSHPADEGRSRRARRRCSTTRS